MRRKEGIFCNTALIVRKKYFWRWIHPSRKSVQISSESKSTVLQNPESTEICQKKLQNSVAVWVEATGAPCAVCKRYYASTSRACDQDGHTSDSTYTCTWINGVFWPLWPVIHRPGCLGQDQCVGESTGGWTVARLVPPLPFVSYYRVTNFNVPLFVCFYTSTVGRQSVLSVFSQFY